MAVLEKRSKKPKKQVVYCRKTGLFCSYSVDCKWLNDKSNFPIGGCKNQNKNLVATQIAEEITYGLSEK